MSQPNGSFPCPMCSSSIYSTSDEPVVRCSACGWDLSAKSVSAAIIVRRVVELEALCDSYDVRTTKARNALLYSAGIPEEIGDLEERIFALAQQRDEALSIAEVRKLNLRDVTREHNAAYSTIEAMQAERVRLGDDLAAARVEIDRLTEALAAARRTYRNSHKRPPENPCMDCIPGKGGCGDCGKSAWYAAELKKFREEALG